VLDPRLKILAAKKKKITGIQNLKNIHNLITVDNEVVVHCKVSSFYAACILSRKLRSLHVTNFDNSYFVPLLSGTGPRGRSPLGPQSSRLSAPLQGPMHSTTQRLTPQCTVRCTSVTLSQCHSVQVLPCHSVTVWQYHPVILSQCISVAVTETQSDPCHSARQGHLAEGVDVFVKKFLEGGVGEKGVEVVCRGQADDGAVGVPRPTPGHIQ